MGTVMKLTSLLFVALLLGGCSDSDLPESFNLESFRVLALIADQPDVDPGTTVTITPLISDIAGGGRTITFSAKACIDPGVAYGAAPSCDGTATEITLTTNTPLTGLVAPNYTGLATSTLAVTVPSASVIFGQASTRDQFNGVDYLITLSFSLPDGSVVRSFRRISVSTRTSKNQNPAYEAVPLLSGDAPLTSLPSTEFNLHVDLTPASQETYEEIRFDGVQINQTEALETSWFISDGELTPSVTDDEGATKITPADQAPADHDTVIVAVTRDGRGGVVATVQTF